MQKGQLTLDAWGRGFDVLVDKPCYSRTFYLDSMVDAGHAVAGMWAYVTYALRVSQHNGVS